jgi:site-specific DNA-cytosine methylase
MTVALRIVEFFCGIGGATAALGPQAKIVAAVDQNALAADVYALNMGHRPRVQTVESLPASFFREAQADLWWLSPPCQPFTSRGQRRDLADPRTVGLRRLLEHVATVRPRCLALENVPGFVDSQARQLCLDTLGQAGYQVVERILCPTQLGIPNRRRRYYLLASQGPMPSWPEIVFRPRPLASYLQTDAELAPLLDQLIIPPADAARYAYELQTVDASDPQAIAACFTSGYAKSPRQSGAVLKTSAGLRRFSPREILRLLGYAESFRFPSSLTLRQQWHLVGNSLSLPAVRCVLSPLLAGR